MVVTNFMTQNDKSADRFLFSRFDTGSTFLDIFQSQDQSSTKFCSIETGLGRLKKIIQAITKLVDIESKLFTQII